MFEDYALGAAHVSSHGQHLSGTLSLSLLCLILAHTSSPTLVLMTFCSLLAEESPALSLDLRSNKVTALH